MKWIISISILLNCLFGYLSYRFYAEQEAAKVALISCQETNSYLGKTIEKKEQEATLRDSVISEYEVKQRKIQNNKCKIVKAISSLPSRTNNEEINIDSKLPVELKRLLQQSHSSVSGQASSDATKSSE